MELNWSKELPQTEGDYLWVAMWGCDCCVRKNGVVTIRDVTNACAEWLEDVKDNFTYTTKEGKTFMFLGPDEDMPDLEDGKYPEVDGWLELTSLPDSQPARDVDGEP